MAAGGDDGMAEKVHAGEARNVKVDIDGPLASLNGSKTVNLLVPIMLHPDTRDIGMHEHPSVLFIVSVGLSVTMCLMGFVNLAHGAFAMLGGYVIVLSMRQWGLDFISALALGFIVIAAVSVVFERLLYVRLYRAAELDQVLFTIGLVFIMIASVTLLIGPENQQLTLPAWLQGQIDLGIVQYRTYSIFLIVVGT